MTGLASWEVFLPAKLLKTSRLALSYMASRWYASAYRMTYDVVYNHAVVAVAASARTNRADRSPAGGRQPQRSSLQRPTTEIMQMLAKANTNISYQGVSAVGGTPRAESPQAQPHSELERACQRLKPAAVTIAYIQNVRKESHVSLESGAGAL